MNLSDALKSSVLPALSMLPKPMDSSAACVMLLSIGLQESGFKFRRQMGNGPALGFWQFEKGGGVRGVLTHDATWHHAMRLCAASGVKAAPAPVWNAMERDDVLAAGFARLLLWSDPKPLPSTSDAAWALYLRTWRPGKPHPETWPKYFEMSKLAVMG